MSIILVVGTRPELIKMAPVIKELDSNHVPFLLVHSGQHYDYDMSQLFFSELRIRAPDVSFSLEKTNPAAQIGEMMVKLQSALGDNARSGREIMLVQGDTNTMLSAGLCAVKMNLQLGHIEAGIRSRDWRMPEEHNRRMIDHVSDYLFCPTTSAQENLKEEHSWGRTYVTGNTVIDSVNQYLKWIEKAELKIREQVKFERFALLTLHRAENVDDVKTLTNIASILKESPIPVVFPVHPRTRKRLTEMNLLRIFESLPNLKMLPPLGYFEFLALMKSCEVILTDSGGIQEEATHPAIRKSVLVLRNSTERPEAVESGFAKVVGTSHTRVIRELKRLLNDGPKLPRTSPYGDGKASVRIVRVLKSRLADEARRGSRENPRRTTHSISILRS